MIEFSISGKLMEVQLEHYSSQKDRFLTLSSQATASDLDIVDGDVNEDFSEGLELSSLGWMPTSTPFVHCSIASEIVTCELGSVGGGRFGHTEPSSGVASPLVAAKRKFAIQEEESPATIIAEPERVFDLLSSPKIPLKCDNNFLSSKQTVLIRPFPLNDITNLASAKMNKISHWTFNDSRESLSDSIPLPKIRRAISECTALEESRDGGFSVSSGEIGYLLNGNLGVPENILPCFDSPRDAIKRITPETMTQILNGKFADTYTNLIIVDCRYPYEYHGGHLPGATNICSFDDIDRLLFTNSDFTNSTSTVIIFHCEFSSERAPRMALHVRNLDRVLNAERYPELHFPQIYILDGGYKSFYLQFPENCDPPYQYVPMRDVGKRDELRYHQRLKFVDSSSHGKHRHKLRSCSLRKSYSLAMPNPVAAVSTFLKNRETIEADKRTECCGILSSDIGDICDQTEDILKAAESVLLSGFDGRISK